MKREPLVTAAVVVSIVGAIVALLKSFGVDLTNEQQAAISGFATVISPLLVALLVRPKVTPVDAPAKDPVAGYGAVELLVVVILLVILVLLIAPHI